MNLPGSLQALLMVLPSVGFFCGQSEIDGTNHGQDRKRMAPRSLQLKGFAEFSQDEEVQAELREIRYRNKLRLATYIEKHNGIKVDPNSIFDVQIKRLHEYKRQLLNVLHIMALYNRLLENPDLEVPPAPLSSRAKAAPGYRMAKLIIKLIHSVGEAINSDPHSR